MNARRWFGALMLVGALVTLGVGAYGQDKGKDDKDKDKGKDKTEVKKDVKKSDTAAAPNAAKKTPPMPDRNPPKDGSPTKALTPLAAKPCAICSTARTADIRPLCSPVSSVVSKIFTTAPTPANKVLTF